MKLRMLLRVIATSALLAVASTPVAQAARSERVHRVYPGQRLESIAKRYRVRVEALRTANDLEPGQRIFPGQELLVPGPDDPDGTKAAEKHDAAVAEKEKEAAKDAAKDKQRAPAKEPRGEVEKAKKEPAERKSDGPKVHVVAPGHRLESIARRYRVPLDAIVTANDLEPEERIHPGDKLVIPSRDDEDGTEARLARASLLDPNDPKEKERADRRVKVRSERRRTEVAQAWRQYLVRPKRRGQLELTFNGHQFRGPVLGRNGKLLPKAKAKLDAILTGGNLPSGMHARLLELVVRVSDAFGGRKLTVVSAWRTASYAAHSRHRMGHAMDFKVDGVPNEALRDLALTFDDVGVGYYPNSSFVHFDVRATKTYWIDRSGPGEAPAYAFTGADKPR